MSNFFAYLSRMKFIQRWGLMRNTYPENIQEHSARVAMIAHALAVIRNERFGGDVNPDRIAVLALYHDASEVFTGDLPAPVKYSNPEINSAYKALESTATRKLQDMLPNDLRRTFDGILVPEASEEDHVALVKAADKLCAYLKCLEEIGAGNREFADAETTLRTSVEEMELPEVAYFMETFVPGFRLTLDELEIGT
ncbi:MAG: 5'-deoxynucleotidase [Candidatus Latescibacteria bacterium]|nr:5'-deoxynucleotidase [Candidatus Latescibacterota bacterium]